VTTAPPDVPSIATLPQPLTNYLRRLSAWAYQQIDSKAPQQAAVPFILLTPNDQVSPNTVFQLTVDSTGALTVTQVALGKGSP
jgi:hypothetical protein